MGMVIKIECSDAPCIGCNTFLRRGWMAILVVGSVAFDSVETPFGSADDALGGSATYFSTSASFFAPVRLVAVVGEDFPEEHISMLAEKGVDLKGLKRAKGRTFRWKGRYGFDLNEAHTLDTQLNVFEDFFPDIPEDYRDTPYIFLGNIDPDLQMEVLNQVRKPRLVACDTMNFWIERKPDALERLLKRVDILTINEGEARELSGEPNLVKASRKILDMGPKGLIIKRGEYGVLMFNGSSIFATPAYPLESVFDPTGAGDTFAGGFMGFIAYTDSIEEDSIRQAIVVGSVMASFNVEDFSLNRLKSLTYDEIEARYREFKRLTEFRDI